MSKPKKRVHQEDEGRDSRKRDFAARLKRWRADYGYTQAEAATHLNVPLRSYENWEGARYAPDQTGPILRMIELWKPTKRGGTS